MISKESLLIEKNTNDSQGILIIWRAVLCWFWISISILYYLKFEEIKRKMAIVFLFHKMCKIHVLHVFYRNDGYFSTQIPPIQDKIHSLVQFNFWKQDRNQNKTMNRTMLFKIIEKCIIHVGLSFICLNSLCFL